MTTSTLSQPSDHLGPVRSCPGCGGREFRVEQELGSVVFACGGCGTSWRYELGFVWPVVRPGQESGHSSV